VRTPLAVINKCLEELDIEIRRWIVKADQHLKWGEYDNAIPYLESVIVRTPSYPRLQVLLWELLGNAQMATGMSKKASICYLHHLAHCRSQGDFKGLSRAQCNLGIAYMHLGLLKLAGRCFLQYLGHCRSLQDQHGVESACSNLGLLSKALALKSYKEASGRGEEGVAMSALAACLRKAIIFFKQHLEIVLAHGNM
jgi:tetratricopeptide (TPR) repeat protein